MDPEDDDSPRSGSTYRMANNAAYTSDETQIGTGPDLAALFVVQGSDKSGHDTPRNTDMALPPSYSSVSHCLVPWGTVK